MQSVRFGITAGTQRFGGNEADYDRMVKLASNENNWGPPDAVMKAMNGAWKYGDAHRLRRGHRPSSSARCVRTRLSEEGRDDGGARREASNNQGPADTGGPPRQRGFAPVRICHHRRTGDSGGASGGVLM